MNGTVGPRTHIFWQRRIREGDSETPYWFPSETRGGALGEARIVLPIPPGTHWSDAKPAVLPGMDEAMKALPCDSRAPRGGNPADGTGSPPARGRRKEMPKFVQPPSRGVWIAPPAPTKEQLAAAKKEKAKQKPTPRMRFKNDPKLVGAARELRDRYLEEVNAGRFLPGPGANGKYDVSRPRPRTLEAEVSELKPSPLLLNAA